MADFLHSIIETAVTEIRLQQEGTIVRAASECLGISINKERLEQALMDASAFWNEGYEAGRKAAARPQGEWIDLYGYQYANHRYVCSRCREDALYKIEADALGREHYVQALSDSCPHCGAKMKGADNNADDS